MNTVFESSNSKGFSQISCIKYKNLNNLSHYHSDYELIHINEGSALISVNEHLFKVHENGSVFVNSNDIHHIHADENTIITVLKADWEFFEKVFAQKALSSPQIPKDIDVKHFLEAVYAELKRDDENSDLMANCMTVQFFITLLRNSKTVERKAEASGRMSIHEIYRELCRKIADEYVSITFEEAARHMKFSEPHFSKVFHNIFGMTFTQYLNTVRIAAALEKIKQGHMNITEIAYSCGFNTIRNFNRVFKNFTGYSPKNIPSDYVFLYNLQDGYGLDPTLNCTIVLNE
jgi:AraC-like DNA-binding protein